jgi:hypothetical protein
MSPEQHPPAPTLVCVECGASSVHGDGWKAELATGFELDDTDEIGVYCPSCWAREFG